MTVQPSPVVSADAARSFVAAAGASGGVPESQLDLFVASFVEADLRGVETHGMIRIPAYVRAFLRGIVNAAPAISVVNDGSASALIDGDNGLGMVVGQVAMDMAVQRAREYGVGAVSVRNSNHSGMLAVHVQRAVDQGMLGFFTSGGAPIMAAWGGADAVLGNGPFAWGIPRATAFPIVVDMAASTAARGKIRVLAAEGKSIPQGWAVDATGNPTTDARAAMEGVILPMAGHKGYGIAVAMEVLSSVLSGSQLAAEAPRDFLKEGSTVLDSWKIGHFALALNLEVFDHSFQETLERLVVILTRSRLAKGVDRVLLPGQPEWERRQDRLQHGIPISPRVLSALDAFAAEVGIDPLRTQPA